ncbi:MAG: PRC-barrel domain-containing protein [Syntrophales bacterium]|jgi:sporulation protein YlmC with PRC-barrel domain|nr:PRC-barrel domain-containing protein [Syntrophales bacterium]MDY0043670.1 PRC-barrel domain-containing protein [Syntrophales bacterium]
MRKLMLLAVVALLCAFVGSTAFAAGEKATSAAAGQMAMGAGQSVMASNIIDYSVKSDTGEELGNVEDILLSQDGRAQYIMVSTGMGDTLIPVPFRAAKMDVSDKAIILQKIDKSKLENAPTLTKEDWQQRVGDVEFEREVHSYYGQEVPVELQKKPSQYPSSGNPQGPAQFRGGAGVKVPGED